MENLLLMDLWSAARHRPAMYIGSIDINGITFLAQEILRDAMEEFMSGHCQRIGVTIHLDGSLCITDDGRAPDCNETQILLTKRHHLPERAKGRLFCTGGLLHGFGVATVAALSAWLVCEIHDGAHRWQIRCEAPNNVRPEVWEDKGVCVPGETGVSFNFLPDPEIFGETTWDSGRLLRWLWEQAHLYPGLTITFTNEREGCEPQVLCAPEGIRELLAWGLADKTPIHPTIITGMGIYEGMRVDLALSFIEEEPTWRMYGCGIPLIEGSTPLTGLRTGLSRTLGKLAGRTGISFQPEKARLGIATIVSVWTDNPIFGSPTGDRLQNPEAEVAVARVVRDALVTHARHHPDEMQAILAAL